MTQTPLLSGKPRVKPCLSRWLPGLLLISSITGCATIPQTTSDTAEQALTDNPEQQQAKILTKERMPPVEENPMYRMMVAELAVDNGDSELAVKNYLSLALSENDPRFAERAVRIAVFAQDMPAAAQAAERWVELEPERSDALQVIAAIYIRQNKPELASQYLSRYIAQQNPLRESTFSSLMSQLAREKNNDTLLQVSRSIADEYPQFAYAQYLHGYLATRGNNAQEALNYLDRALAITNIADAHTLRGKMLIKLGRNDEAVDSLRNAVLSKPNNKNLRLAYARLLVDVKQYEKARIEFEKLQLMYPEDSDLLYSLSLLSLEAKRLDDAEKYLKALLKTGKRTSEARYYMGRIAQNRGQLDTAVNWYQNVHSGEYHFDSQMRIANLLSRQGKTQQALEFLKKAQERSQSNTSLIRIFLTRGDILIDAGRLQDAIDNYNLGLEAIPGNIDLLYARGLTAEDLGDPAQLESDMREILKTEPDNSHALNALGYTMADHNDRLEEAFGYIQRALEITPDDPAYLDSFGWIHYRMGRYEEAIHYLRKALSIIEDGEIAAHLGEVLWITGKRDEALKTWDKVLQESPDDPFITETMKRLQQTD